MTHQIISTTVMVALAMVAAWTLYRLRRRESDRATRAMGIVGIVLFLALAANEVYRLTEIVGAPAALSVIATEGVSSCAK